MLHMCDVLSGWTGPAACAPCSLESVNPTPKSGPNGVFFGRDVRSVRTNSGARRASHDTRLTFNTLHVDVQAVMRKSGAAAARLGGAGRWERALAAAAWALPLAVTRNVTPSAPNGTYVCMKRKQVACPPLDSALRPCRPRHPSRRQASCPPHIVAAGSRG